LHQPSQADAAFAARNVGRTPMTSLSVRPGGVARTVDDHELRPRNAGRQLLLALRWKHEVLPPDHHQRGDGDLTGRSIINQPSSSGDRRRSKPRGKNQAVNLLRVNAHEALGDVAAWRGLKANDSRSASTGRHAGGGHPPVTSPEVALGRLVGVGHWLRFLEGSNATFGAPLGGCVMWSVRGRALPRGLC
jgi:hypothetical protein